VSSGAIAAGMSRLNWKQRPATVGHLQAAAAVGQMGLVQTYETSFKRFNRQTAQILLDHDDMANRERYLNARSTLQTLLSYSVIPIINENDTVVTDEIRFGDNDRLAAIVANLLDAEVLVILTDQEGLFDSDPKYNDKASLISEVESDDIRLDTAAFGGNTNIGRGGMLTKLQAARQAANSGCSTIIAGGFLDKIISRISKGEKVGTFLKTKKKPLTARKKWLASQLQVRGALHLDAGASEVLMQKGRSLLPVGVVSVEGDFSRGDLVSCLDDNKQEIARGLVNYSSADTKLIKGRGTSSIFDALGFREEDELIHRDNLVVLA
jgi:glutamate 5-kinase